MKIKNILIVHKKSAYELLHANRQRIMRIKNSATRKEREYFLKSHKDHYATVEHIEKILKEKGLKFKRVFRDRNIHYKKYDLIITVGGDGTFLKAISQIDRQYILGVNSAPKYSVGKLCSASQKTFKRAIEQIQQDKFDVTLLHRIELQFPSRREKYLALNDCLIAHANPADLSRYIIQIGTRLEKQRSSGIWISTAVGSTGAMKSAGGRILKETARQFQYRARELYSDKISYKLKGGVLSARATVKITSLMHNGYVYIDGSRKRVPFPYGQELHVKLSAKPVRSIKVK